ncbi:hypothetical protein KR222_005338, partial [Zaprionus bogoriensis]
VVASSRTSTMGQATPTGSGARWAITKKLLLWSILMLQMGFIGCFWLLQMHRSHLQQQQPQTQQQLSSVPSDADASARVHFIRKPKETLLSAANGRRSCAYREQLNRFQHDFFQLKPDRLNRSADYMDPELAPSLWCYSEGTLRENRTQQDDRDYLQAQPQCLCAGGWHGRDCGQPEIIWRALMTHSRASRRGGVEAPLQLHEANAAAVKRLYYLLDLGAWEHINMELLQLQLQTLLEVVDFFLIYYYVAEGENAHRQQHQQRLQRNIKHMPRSGAGAGSSSYLIYQCSRANCSTAAAFGHFRQQLWKLCGVQVQATDLLLYGERDAIYAPAALKFLKYYAKDVLPLRFRLKHNVYGFYWQHPLRTRLQGLIGCVRHMHAAQLDVRRLERQTSYTLGDLNHYGGWLCELCLPPEQIVQLLQQSPRDELRQNDVKRIDAPYMQQLIGGGVYLDGSTQLLRLRQQSEKYFAPEQALQHSSQFGQLLFNSYDVNGWEDVEDEE